MCGIVFGVRSSSSFFASGSTLPTDAEIAPGDSPDSWASTPDTYYAGLVPPTDESGSIVRDRSSQGFGIPFPDGQKTDLYLDSNETWRTLTEAVAPRGPDHSSTLIKHIRTKRKFHFELRFHASVLHMRGKTLQKQPFTAPNGDVLLFNGEVFDGLEIGEDENDGAKLFERIQEEGPSNFFASIRNIEGPYALVYYQAANHRIYYARDPLGRRSLLIHEPTPISPSLFITSNGPSIDYPLHEFKEVSCDAVHCYHLLDLKGKSWLVDGVRGLSSYPRYPKSMGLSQDILIYPFNRLRPQLPLPSNLLPRDLRGGAFISSEMHLVIQSFLRELDTATRKRVTGVPIRDAAAPKRARIAVFFSGGLDCTTLALMAEKWIPPDEEIDLINVAFENPRAMSARRKQEAMVAEAIRKRAAKSAKGKAKAEDGDVEMDGVPLEPAPHQPAGEDEDDTYLTPDRVTGLASLAELRSLRPRRRWNFVCVDVSFQETERERSKVIDLMWPSKTVMDLSIAVAFYFAARGAGTLYQGPGKPRPAYTSTARVILSGLGADELLGGYGRHRKAFFGGSTPPASASPKDSAGGTIGVGGDWKALNDEMQLDLDRLPSRNLGRDDRIVSYHGKEVRYPFLAGDVVDFLARTPVWMKCDMRFDEGVGDKLLLRLSAKALGLNEAAARRKRAIQFGARSAKMEGDQKGDDDVDLR